MSYIKQVETAIRERERTTRKWIQAEAPEVTVHQKHLDSGSTERAYWHYGYLTAMRDIMRFLGKSKAAVS